MSVSEYFQQKGNLSSVVKHFMFDSKIDESLFYDVMEKLMVKL